LKRLLVPLALVILLASCAPAAPVTPSVTPVPPTTTARPAPTQTMTAEPTSTPEPTATAEPTKIPMPEEWTAVAETKEIGGRQVVLNEKGDAATRIDGEWYPVDAKGCFYKEFFDPEIQKKDPEIMELVDKINGEEPFSALNLSITQRHFAEALVGRLKKDRYPVINEFQVDSIIYDQKHCFNSFTGEWEHVIDFVLPTDVKQTPKDIVALRGVVGWIRNGEYISFTYKQPSFRGTQSGYEKLRDVSGTTAQKANSVKDASKLWSDLIEEKQQVGVRMPLSVFAGQNVDVTDQNYEKYVEDLSSEVFLEDPILWSETISDPEFVRWALTGNNQLRYMTDSKNRKEWLINNRMTFWQYRSLGIADGKLPELFVRVVEVQGE